MDGELDGQGEAAGGGHGPGSREKGVHMNVMAVRATEGLTNPFKRSRYHRRQGSNCRGDARQDPETV